MSIPSRENLQWVGPLLCLPKLLRRFDVDPVDVLASAELRGDALDDPKATIPFRAMGALFDAAVEKTGCAHLGLEMGKQFQSDSLGLVGELMRNAPTVGSALQDFVMHQHRNAHGSVAYLLPNKRHMFLGYAVYEPQIRGYQFICDWVAMAGFNLLRELAGFANLNAVEVFFSRSEPQDLEPYRQAFGVKLHFDAEQTALMLPQAMLAQPIAGADDNRRDFLGKYVAEQWHAGELDIVTQLRRILRVTLIAGGVSAAEISRQMGLSRRTLHRRLDAAGYKFQDILDETRCEFAQQVLRNTRLDIREIAAIVGYSDPSILTRAFKRWTGVSPSDWRLSHSIQLEGKLHTECAHAS